MRFLFRAKTLNTGQFVKGYLKTPVIISSNDNDYHIDPDTIGQFTGKTDINGLSIFSGDIVRLRNGKFTFNFCMIVWDEKRYRFSLKTKQYSYPMSDAFQYEIVGNIYDNAELLDLLGRE